MTATADGRRRVRILLYSCNGKGLGHLTRLTAIARCLRTLAVDAGLEPEIVQLTSSEASHLAAREGFAIFKVGSRDTVADLLPHFIDEYFGVRNAEAGVGARITLDIMEHLAPDLLVNDTEPCGFLNEMQLQDTLPGRFTAFVYRDRFERKRGPTFWRCMSRYERILIPYPAGLLPFDMPEDLASKAVHTGNIMIRDRGDLRPRSEARAALGLPYDGLALYITAGGGGDPEHAAELSKLRQAATDAGMAVVVGTGPLAATGPGVRPGESSHYPMMELFNAFDGAISAGGYNTVGELLHAGVPTAVYTQAKGWDDQQGRIDAYARQGALLPATLEDDSLRGVLAAFAEPERRAELRRGALAAVPVNGAWTAAASLLELLLDDGARAAARRRADERQAQAAEPAS